MTRPGFDLIPLEDTKGQLTDRSARGRDEQERSGFQNS